MPRKKVNKKIDKKLERLLKEKKNIENSTISIKKNNTNTKKASKRKKDEIIVPDRNIKKSRKKDTIVVKERKKTTPYRKRSLTVSKTEKEKIENNSFQEKEIDEDSIRTAEFEKEMQTLYDKIDSSDYTAIINQEIQQDEISTNEKEEKLKEVITDAKIRNINDDIIPKKKVNILKIITIILAILFIILLIAFFLFIYYVCTY